MTSNPAPPLLRLPVRNILVVDEHLGFCDWITRILPLDTFKVFTVSAGIFHENVVNKIYDDIKAILKPKYLKVFGDFSVRGGIKTTVKRES